MTRSGLGISAARKTHTQELGCLAFRFLVAIDIEGFSQRYAAEQARVQNDLENAMSQAAANAGLDRERWYRQPRGDGELAVLPQGVDGLALVSRYPRMLASAVAGINRAGSGVPRLRVRLAIHHGAVTPGLFGPVGVAPVVVSRLVDAETVRQLRQHRDLEVVLIVSAIVYDEVIRSRLHNLNPETFRRTIFRAKGTLVSRDGLVPVPRGGPAQLAASYQPGILTATNS